MRAAEALGNEECPVRMKLVAPPLYVLTTATLDKAKGVEVRRGCSMHRHCFVACTVLLARTCEVCSACKLNDVVIGERLAKEQTQQGGRSGAAPLVSNGFVSCLYKIKGVGVRMKLVAPPLYVLTAATLDKAKGVEVRGL
jgi:hypothetical protein